MLKFKLIIFHGLLFMAWLNCSSNEPLPIVSEQSSQTVDHEQWDILLKKHVDDKGNVDYKGFKRDAPLLDAYLMYLGQKPISNTASKEERLAFYINLYNAATVQMILENQPLNSIKDIFRPWGKQRIQLGKRKYSLGRY